MLSIYFISNLVILLESFLLLSLSSFYTTLLYTITYFLIINALLYNTYA